MRRRYKFQIKKILNSKKIFAMIFVIFLGLGFAFLSTELMITGNTSVSGNKWSIYFDNIQISPESIEAVTEPKINENKTTVNYSVVLDKPGDFYEFTVDAINDGTIDAMIESVVKTQFNEEILKIITFDITYADGTEIAEQDLLEAKKNVTYRIRVEYKKNVDESDLSNEEVNLNLNFTVNYVQSTIKKEKEEPAIVKIIKDEAILDNNVDFTQIDGSTIGKRIYIRTGTEDDEYPVYYYRGSASNNALFAGFCWKIVRTTSTGGTKLLYSGLPNENGYCGNTKTAAQLSTTSSYNTNKDSPAYVGYMYGEVYAKSTRSQVQNYLYGNSFTYSNGTYTLVDTKTASDSTHHYTCFNTSGTCSSIYYAYYAPNTGTSYYITIKNGKGIEDAIREMQENRNDSDIKRVVDTWFANTFIPYFTNIGKDYNDYLEDTIWCNDRSVSSMNGWDPNGNIGNYLYYAFYDRKTNGTPIVTCPNKNDSFTVNDTENGNGALTYPVGLLTGDEAMMAGGQARINSSFYLYTNEDWWHMTPSRFSADMACVTDISSGGSLGDPYSYYEDGVRPVISISKNVKIKTGGNGTWTKPYEFIIE